MKKKWQNKCKIARKTTGKLVLHLTQQTLHSKILIKNLLVATRALFSFLLTKSKVGKTLRIEKIGCLFAFPFGMFEICLQFNRLIYSNEEKKSFAVFNLIE